MFANDGCHVSWLGTNTIYFCLPKSVLTLSGNVASGVSKKAESMDFMYFMPSLFAYFDILFKFSAPSLCPCAVGLPNPCFGHLSMTRSPSF